MELAGGLCLIAALTLGGLLLQTLWRLRATRLACAGFERERAAAMAVLDTVPLAGFRWPPGVEREGVAVRSDPFPQFLARFDADDGARVEAAQRALRRRGAPFSLRLETRSGEVLAIEGRQAASGESVLWLLDESAAARALRVDEEVVRLRELIDAIPAPMWRRGPDRGLIECNRAYAFAVDATREAALAQNLELAASDLWKTISLAAGPTKAADRRTEHRHVVIDGARRLLEITEMPCRDGGTIGFALDRTESEAAEAELQRHISAHAAVLEGIGAAVAIYGADRRLKFFNSAFASLWSLEAEWLAAEPSFGDVLERLHEHRRIPERADFSAFKHERIGLFTSR